MNTIRLELDSKEPQRHLVDQRTGKPPFIVRGESVRLEFGFFHDTEFVGRDGTINVVLASENNPGQFTTSFANTSLTPQQWRAGIGWHAALTLTADITGALPEGGNLFSVVVFWQSQEAFAPTTVFADTEINVLQTYLTTFTQLGGILEPIGYYTRSTSDSRFAFRTELGDLQGAVLGLETANNSLAANVVTVTTAAFTSAQQAVARSNIGAGLEGVAATIVGGSLDLLSATVHTLTLTADTTLTATAAVPGKEYLVKLAQDATGGRDVAWPFPAAVAADPRPGAITKFRIADGAVTTWDYPPSPSEPVFTFDLALRGRHVLAAGALTSLADPYSSKTFASVGAKAIYPSLLGGHPAALFALGGYTAPDLMEPTISGVTVMAIFSSASTADMRLLTLGPLGLVIDQRGGGIEFGSADATSSRVAIPTASNDNATAVFIGVLAAGGFAGYLYKAGSHRVAYKDGTRGTPAGSYEIAQATGGTLRWSGKIARISAWSYAMPWAQVQALAQRIISEF